MIEIGIITSQKTVSQPLTLRMKTGSSWTDPQQDRRRRNTPTH
jgi:hypothetical protein